MDSTGIQYCFSRIHFTGKNVETASLDHSKHFFSTGNLRIGQFRCWIQRDSVPDFPWIGHGIDDFKFHGSQLMRAAASA